jgi:GT2 family glycosyltransferase
MNSRELRQRIEYLDGSFIDAFKFGGGICGISSALFNELSGFQGEFKFYGSEDVELGQKILLLGGKIRFCKNARVTHYDLVDPLRLKLKTIENAAYGLWYLHRNHQSMIKNHKVINLLIFICRYKNLSILLCYFIKIIEKPLFIFSKLIEGKRRFYFPLLYKILMLFWTFIGLSVPISPKFGISSVSKIDYKDYF